MGAGLTHAIALGALVLFGSVLVTVAGRPLATDDTWWHLVMGRLYASGDLWPRADPLLHTTVLRPPVPHEWLFQVALFRLQEAAGFTGLRLLHAGLVAVILGGAFRIFRGAARDWTLAALATLVFAALSWFRIVQLRPELVTVLAIFGMYALVLGSERIPTTARIGGALVVFVLWVNAHSLFAIGLCLLVAALLGCGLEALLGRTLRNERADSGRRGATRRASRLAWLLGLAIVVTWLNPRGFEQHLTFFTESDAGLIWKIRDDFLPWHPFVPPDPAGPAFTGFAWALSGLLYAAFGGVAARRALVFARRRDVASLADFDAVHFGLGLAAFVASLVAVRFHWLAVFPLLYLLRAVGAHGPTVLLRATGALVTVGLAVAIPVTGGFSSYVGEVARESGGYRGAEWLDERYCGPGTRFLSEAGLTGRLYHPFNLGGFLGYWLSPGLRTFIDGRLDHVSAEVLDDYLAIRRTSTRGPTRPLRERLDRWGIDLFFADRFAPEWYAGRLSGTHLRRLPEWLPIYASRTHVVYLRRNPRNAANLERVVAYYEREGVPFDRRGGLPVGRVLREAPAWARAQRLSLPAQAALERAAAEGAPEAIESLAAHYWRIGDFEAQVALDQQTVREDPGARGPAVRLADAWLQLGRPRAALRALAPLDRGGPEDLEIRILEGRARAAASGREN